MDLVLSLPILSYLFFSPSTASWSAASLNVVFFYMTWSTLVLSQPAIRVHLAGLLALRVLLLLLPSLVFFAFDSLVPSLAGPIKLGGGSGLPPSRKPAELARHLALAVLNLLLGVAVEGGVVWGLGWLFSSSSRGAPVFKTSTTLPLPWHVVRHVGFLLAAREVLAYYIHRDVLHASSSSSRAAPARLHGCYAHARAAPPMALSILTDHPLPYLAHRVVPQLLPALAIRPHLITYFVFVALATLEETLAMSGYSVVPGIIMGGVTRRTAIHYAAGGSANYAPWGVMDWACGTGSGGGVLEGVMRRGTGQKGKKKK